MSSKRLIEVDLPIGVISQHSVHEQNVRKGHLHSVHVWWATRPLSACRAVILASLLSDPADEHCGEDVRQLTRSKIDWLMSGNLDDPMILRKALLDFIGNVSDWDKSNDERFLNTAREILRVHNPEGALVADPFAGIGSIPFETLRLGLDAFASDLNPVSVLLLQTVLGDLPKYGKDLSQAVRHWGDWVEQRARKKLEQFYPPEKGGGLPLAYLWARTVRCEGPGCGARLPLVGLLWLSQKGKQKAALRYWGDRKNKTVLFEIFSPKSETQVQSSIANRFTATCPVCPQNYTTSYASVVQQLKAKQGDTRDAQLIAVIVVQPDGKRTFRLATEMDLKVVEAARLALKKDQQSATEIGLSLLPDEPTPNSRGPGASRAFSLRRYGMDTWGHAFTERQGLTLSVFERLFAKHTSRC